LFGVELAVGGWRSSSGTTLLVNSKLPPLRRGEVRRAGEKERRREGEKERRREGEKEKSRCDGVGYCTVDEDCMQ
jgi:hypothetical protein